jgi:fibronectin-binding autotransporter adhesin
MKKLQVARFLSAIIAVLFGKITAATQDTNNYTLNSNPNENGNIYSTGIISGTGPYQMNGTGTLRLAGTNTFSGGVRINSTSAAAILGLGYPPAGFTTAIPNTATNSYMGTGRIINFGNTGGSANRGGILELGCDMSNANLTLMSRTGSVGAIIRGYNQTSAYTIRFSSYITGVQAAGPITIGAGATVILGFPLPVGSSSTQYSAFNVGGTATNSGTLRLFNGTSSSTAAINANAYGILDCSLCTTASNAGLSSGTFTLRANGTLRFPNATGNFTKAIVLSP